MNDVNKISQAMEEVDKALGSAAQQRLLPQAPTLKNNHTNLPALLMQLKQILERQDQRLARIEQFLGLTS